MQLTKETGSPFSPLIKVVSGKVFPMMLREEGSVEVDVPEGTIIVYQHLLHYLKAASTVQIQIPQTLKSVRHKFESLKKLLKDLMSTDLTEFNEIE